jgi:hypothetical protein
VGAPLNFAPAGAAAYASVRPRRIA